MLDFYKCNHATDRCKHCSHSKPHSFSQFCDEDECSVSSEKVKCVHYISIDIAWKRNSLTGGEDDPHFGTEHAGTHAGLEITNGGQKYFLRCPDFQYGKELPEILKSLMEVLNEKQKR